MERLLVLRLEAIGCTAEAVLNGVPLARVGGAHPLLCSVPVHEFTFAGANELELVISPPPAGNPPSPEPKLSDGHAAAALRLMLPRIGQTAHPASARTLALIEWSPPADELYEVPLSLKRQVDLPIAFPRWRWLEAPVVPESPAVKAQAASFLQGLAVALTRGQYEPFLQAARLRFEETATAYQRDVTADVQRWRAHLEQLHAQAPLKPELPSVAKLVLRPVAGGRLLECLAQDGEPILRSETAGGGRILWPMRIAAVDGRFYVLR